LGSGSVGLAGGPTGESTQRTRTANATPRSCATSVISKCAASYAWVASDTAARWTMLRVIGKGSSDSLVPFRRRRADEAEDVGNEADRWGVEAGSCPVVRGSVSVEAGSGAIEKGGSVGEVEQRPSSR
jgi:hypothetical protein